jgi:signal transduction histidine kinase
LNADKDRFISILAHDLKNPLGGFVGLTEALIEDLQNNQTTDVNEIANLLSTSAQKTYTLLEETLTWVRGQSGKLPFQPEKIVFKKICTDVIGLYCENAKAKSISINLKDDENICINADENMIKTVLRNLISNAIKFTNHSGVINIDVQKRYTNAIITIADNGVGIDEKNLQKLMEISQHYTTVGTANEEGTGLGLLICKEFIEKHNGKIWVTSKIGEGTSFSFSLPFGDN